MKGAFIGGAVAVLLVVAAQAHGGDRAPASPDAAPARALSADWGAWTRPLAQPAAASAAPAAAAQPVPETPNPEIDVVDAHWMALTMWGEARGGGEAAMRAVGHVIANRGRAGIEARYVTDTVSEDFQFSCWNAGDPNRVAMMNVESLPRDSEDYRRWTLAKRLAEEILSGRSIDPTGGALFYHSVSVAPRWSEGVAPTVQIGSHLFFRTARRA